MEKTRTLTLDRNQVALIISPGGFLSYDIPDKDEFSDQDDLFPAVFLMGLLKSLEKEEIINIVDAEISKWFEIAKPDGQADPANPAA